MKAHCTHEKFHATVDVNRLQENGEETPHGFMADVRIVCVECGTDFVFIGMPYGVSVTNPTMSVNALEAKLPIKPATYAKGKDGTMQAVVGNPAEFMKSMRSLKP